MDVKETLKKRSSARAYTKEALTTEELNQILEAGLQAPTATNRQELHFSVVSGDNPVLEELDEEKRTLRGQEKLPNNFYYQAPTLIMISGEEEFGWSSVDAGIAVQSMALMAESLGLGNLIIGCIKDAMTGEKRAYFEKAFAIPAGNVFQIAFAVGHKSDNKIPHEYDKDKQVTIV